jgi:hypothetical protein
MELHSKQVISLIEGDLMCCPDFPHCDHSTWEAHCPECNETVQSTKFLGPYFCEECDDIFYILVDGWVDKRDAKEKE